MLRHRLTGQVARAMRSIYLPAISLLVLSTALLAQDGSTQRQEHSIASNTARLVPVSATTHIDASSPASSDGRSADLNADDAATAPEPDTLMLLCTGAVVLVLLYSRRRLRGLADANPTAP